jgi:GH24 family phage-related lysozyme (muramidase)
LIDYEPLRDRIKSHEGYRDTVYKDHLMNSTIGYGHLCRKDEVWIEDKKYARKELEKVFEYDFNKAVSQADTLLKSRLSATKDTFNKDAYFVLIEMIFQLGIGNVKKFKKMISALDNRNWLLASQEMLSSRWANQTPQRANELSKIMAGISV